MKEFKLYWQLERDWCNVVRFQSTTKQCGNKNRASVDREGIYTNAITYSESLTSHPPPAFCTFLEVGIHGDIILFARIKIGWKKWRISEQNNDDTWRRRVSEAPHRHNTKGSLHTETWVKISDANRIAATQVN